MSQPDIKERLTALEVGFKAEKAAFEGKIENLEEKLEQERKECNQRFESLEKEVKPVIKTVQRAGWAFSGVIGVGVLAGYFFDKFLQFFGAIKNVVTGHQ